MEVSLLTSKFTLVPSSFFDPASRRDALAEVVALGEGDEVNSIEIPCYGAVLVYATDVNTASVITDNTVSGEDQSLPEMFYLLRGLQSCAEYNKILCSHMEGRLYIAIAQGRTLLLANSFDAPDFTTAEYYIFVALKSLQLNPEVSTICWRSPLDSEQEMSLYRYFKAVETI